MTYEQAQQALLTLARRNSGLITADAVEGDPDLASDRNTVAAAGRALAGETNVFAVPRDDDGWFPYGEIRITVL
jgi:hypothetical protein